MTTIGLRATPSQIWFAVVAHNTDYKIITCDKLVLPIALNFPEKLNFIRKTFKDIIFEYGITTAGIRVTEPAAISTNATRISFEAVLQELLSSSTVYNYFIGQIANISAKIGFNRANFKRYIDDELNFDPIKEWSSFNKEQKEAILSAVAASKL
ncbi:MAG: hypothetical protein ABI675_20990 [Chitinophagaceae bacterium]